MGDKLNIVVFISGNGSNLQSIIDAAESGLIDVSICAVISNNSDAFGLSRAKQHGIYSEVIDHRHFASRADYDHHLLQALQKYQLDYIVLAGFMRILGAGFIEAYSNRILNIHPSILPDYKGLNTHQRALENGETEHGVSIHIVTASLDDGPILLRGRYPIEPQDTVVDLQRKGHALEHQMYPQLLKWLANAELKIQGDSIIFKDKILSQAIEFN